MFPEAVLQGQCHRALNNKGEQASLFIAPNKTQMFGVWNKTNDQIGEWTQDYLDNFWILKAGVPGVLPYKPPI